MQKKCFIISIFVSRIFKNRDVNFQAFEVGNSSKKTVFSAKVCFESALKKQFKKSNAGQEYQQTNKIRHSSKKIL